MNSWEMQGGTETFQRVIAIRSCVLSWFSASSLGTETRFCYSATSLPEFGEASTRLKRMFILAGCPAKAGHKRPHSSSIRNNNSSSCESSAQASAAVIRGP